MKKLVILCLVVLIIQSCSFKQKYNRYQYSDNKSFDTLSFQTHDCSQMVTHYLNYEDTIKRVYLGVDSTIFPINNRRHFEDSLAWSTKDNITKCDIRDNRNGYIFRVWFDFTKYQLDSIYNPQFYSRFR